MEQFKNLNWSWNKYPEEKHEQPRVFDFKTINYADSLSRTLNEIHKCVVPETDKFETFKIPEKLNETSKQLTSDNEPEDPRKHLSRFLSRSFFLINDYGFASKLTSAEQKAIFDSLSKITINPSLITKKGQLAEWKTIPATLNKEVIEKLREEAIHFHNCAELYFYRHNQRFNNLIDDKMKNFIEPRYYELFEDKTHFKAITMLLRDEKCEDEVEFKMVTHDKIELGPYVISENMFPILHRLSTDDLTYYHDLKRSQVAEKDLVSNLEQKVVLPLNLLAMLLDDTELFSVRFTNILNARGEISSKFSRPIPAMPRSIDHALDDFVEFSVHMSIEYDCMERFYRQAGYKGYEKIFGPTAIPADEMMRGLFKSFMDRATSNIKHNIVEIKNESETFDILYKSPHNYFLHTAEENTVAPANISVKMEYQTKFGAEKMTKRELIKEWCTLKFNRPSSTLRYRVDAETLKILSITKVILKKVEMDLESQHKTTTKHLMGNLVKIFSCLQRLPVNNYLMRTKIEGNCKKLYIYEESSSGKETDHESFFELETSFTRKWLVIDHQTPTFLHQKHFFTPCCYPNLNLKNVHPYKPSYQSEKKAIALANATAKATPKANATAKATPKPKKRKRNVKKK